MVYWCIITLVRFIVMKNPLISIITPTWNSAATVERVILSAVNQRYPEIEHIFIDNSSGDKTVSIIRDYRKKYKHIRLISEKDNGVYHGMNKGLNLCTGDWIYFLGADDVFNNEHVLEELFEQGLFSEEQVIYGNVLVKGDTSLAKDGTVYDGPFDLEKLFRKNICHQSIFYPRSVIKQVGYFSDKYRITSDWDYNIRCFAHYQFTYTDKIIAIFEGGGKSSEGGDLSFNEDFPENVVRYFQLDPEDTRLHVINSPFFYPVARSRIERYLNAMQDQKAEHNHLRNQIEEQENQHNEYIKTLKTEHKTSLLKIASENEKVIQNLKSENLHAIKMLMAEIANSIMVLTAKYEQNINLIQTELNTLKVLLSNKEKELTQAVETGKQQAEQLSKIIAIKEEDMKKSRKIYDQEITSLKAMI